MKKEIAMRWIEALRSGKYMQGKGRLRSFYDEFCCLGVLCNLHAIEHPEIAKNEKYKTRYLGMNGLLPIKVMEWAKIKTRGGSFLSKNDNNFYSLTELNDEKHYNFKEIAKVIESNYERL